MRAQVSLRQKCCNRPSVRQSFFPFAQKARPLVRANDIRLLLTAAERANHAASHGLIWPKDGCASIAFAATESVRLSSPGLRPFLAEDKKVSPPPSSAALRPEDGCVVDRLRPADRHRGRDGRGLEQPGEMTWRTSALSRNPARNSRARFEP